MSIVGLAGGLAGSALLSRYLDRMLFGVTALDTTTYAGVSIAFLAVMLAASYIPARQAATLDPQSTMRCE